MEYLIVICSLLGVIGLIFLTYYAAKWLNKKFQGGGFYGSAGGIKVVDCVGIAQDKQLVAVRVGNKAMLLGVTPASITKLSDLDESDMALIEKTQEQGGKAPFSESLKNALAGRLSRNGSGEGEETGDKPQEEMYGKNDKDDF